MTIKILGSGCANCRTLERRAQEALQQLNIPGTVEKVQDFEKIATYGIMRTPAGRRPARLADSAGLVADRFAVRTAAPAVRCSGRPRDLADCLSMLPCKKLALKHVPVNLVRAVGWAKARTRRAHA